MEENRKFHLQMEFDFFPRLFLTYKGNEAKWNLKQSSDIAQPGFEARCSRSVVNSTTSQAMEAPQFMFKKSSEITDLGNILNLNQEMTQLFILRPTCQVCVIEKRYLF